MIYLVVSQNGTDSPDLRAITATDVADAANQIKAALAQGMSVNNGQRATIQVGLIQLEAAGTITPNANPAQATIQTVNQIQAAIADLPAFTVTNVAQANTAVQAIRTLVNTLLTELRLAGIIAP